MLPRGVVVERKPVGSRRGVLTAGHPVDAVVVEDRRDVDVAPAGVDEVVAADGQRVPVAHHRDHGQVGPDQLDAGGERERPAVSCVHRVRVHVERGPAGAADAPHDHEPIHVSVHPVEGGASAATMFPCPHPGHQTLGIFSSRRYRRRSSPIRGTLSPPGPPGRPVARGERPPEQIAGPVGDLVGPDGTPSARFRPATRAAPAAAARTRQHELTQVEALGTRMAAPLPRRRPPAIRERPEGLEAQQPGWHALPPQHVHGGPGRARGDAVGEDDDSRVVQPVRAVAAEARPASSSCATARRSRRSPAAPSVARSVPDSSCGQARHHQPRSSPKARNSGPAKGWKPCGVAGRRRSTTSNLGQLDVLVVGRASRRAGADRQPVGLAEVERLHRHLVCVAD